jgi:hypothetical protein
MTWADLTSSNRAVTWANTLSRSGQAFDSGACVSMAEMAAPSTAADRQYWNVDAVICQNALIFNFTMLALIMLFTQVKDP